MDHQQTQLIDSLIKRAKENGPIKAITLDIGALCNLNPDEVRDYILLKTNSLVTISITPTRIKCKCGYEGQPIIPEQRQGQHLVICPECSALPKIVCGKDIRIHHIEHG